MKLAGINAAYFTDKAKQCKENIKNVYTTNVKPFVKENYGKAKSLATDTIDFAKKNPKKAGKYAAFGLMAISAFTLAVKGIKDFIETKKQNKILANWVLAQRETIADMREITAANSDTIAAQNKVIEKLKQQA